MSFIIALPAIQGSIEIWRTGFFGGSGFTVMGRLKATV
jgi:hypothetical protein